MKRLPREFLGGLIIAFFFCIFIFILAFIDVKFAYLKFIGVGLALCIVFIVGWQSAR